MGTQLTKIPLKVLSSKACITLARLASLEGPVAATELPWPRSVIPLAQHGYVRLTVELTEKGRRALDGDSGQRVTPENPDDYGGDQIIEPMRWLRSGTPDG